jgi:hypothetical protein
MLKRSKKNQLFSFLWFIPIAFLFLQSVYAVVSINITPLHKEKILEKAQSLPHKGELKILLSKNHHTLKTERYIYLKVDNGYITDLYPLLQIEDALINKNSIGAHISVIEEYEAKSLPKNIPEIGNSYFFNIEEVEEIKIYKDSEEMDWYVLSVKSKELEDFRSSYGLSSLPKEDHNFHISIAKRPGAYPRK